MDIENLFIARILIDADFKHAAEEGIREEHFQDEDNHRAFVFVRDYFVEHGAVPPISVMRQRFPDFTVPSRAKGHQVSFLGSELRKVVLHDKFSLALVEAKGRLDEGQPVNAFQEMSVQMQAMVTEVSVMRDLDVNRTWEDRLERYRYARSNPGIQGIPTGFATIDRSTLGLQKKQFIVIIGLPKAGKSALLIAIACAAQVAGNRVLFIGFEMTNQEQTARLDAQRAGVDHMKILSGEMSPEDEVKIIQAGEAAEDFPEFTMTEDPAGLSTVTAVAAKIAQVDPDLVIIDGVYLMDDEHGEPKNSPQALTNITRSLKRVAQRMNVPILCSTQALESKTNKKVGLTAGSTGYSSSFAQDCDTMIGVEMDLAGKQRVSTLLSRNGPRAWCYVVWDWKTSTFEEQTREQHEEDDDLEDVDIEEEEPDQPLSVRRIKTMRGRSA